MYRCECEKPMLINAMFNPFDLRIVKSDEKEVILKALLPGVKEKNITIYYQGGILNLQATGDETGDVSYSVALHDDLDINKSKASLVDGVLMITIPKIVPDKKEIKIGYGPV